MFKVGVIGIGFIGAAHIEALRRLGFIDVVAITTAHDAKEKARNLHVKASYTDYKDMIDNEKLDAIHICTPNYLHHKISIYAMERKINVMCEKPMTSTLEEAEEMLRLANLNNVIHGVNYHNRFNPMVNQMRNMINDGDIGNIMSIHGGYIQDWLLYETDYSWRLLSKESGKTRVVADIGSHWLDTVENTTGLKVEEVFSEFSTYYNTRKKSRSKVIKTFSNEKTSDGYEDIPIDTEDMAMVMLRFNNGAIGSMFISQVFAGKKNKISIFISGTKSSFEWDSENNLNDLILGHRDRYNEVITKDPSLVHKNVRNITGYPGGHVEGFPDTFKYCFSQFYNHIIDKNNPKNFADFNDGLRGMLLIDKIFESAKTGKWVKV